MRDIKQFIEKAIEGGWKRNLVKTLPHIQVPIMAGGKVRFWETKEKTLSTGTMCEYDITEVMLDPKAWQAVGKVEGWGVLGTADIPCSVSAKMGQKEMHGIVNALCEGKSIEDYIKTL